MIDILERLAKLQVQRNHGPVGRVRTRRVRNNPPYIGPSLAYHHPRHRNAKASVYTHYIAAGFTGRLRGTRTQPGGLRLPINPGSLQ
jgi:hypothetical protein